MPEGIVYRSGAIARKPHLVVYMQCCTVWPIAIVAGGIGRCGLCGEVPRDLLRNLPC